VRDGSLLPRGERIRRAVRWLSDHGPCSAGRIDEASRRFDLTPLEEEFLLEHFRERCEGPRRR
jgi:hypothetical protein